MILVSVTDQLNSDRQTGGSGKHRQRDTRSVSPGRENIERGIARTSESCRSLSESAWREQQVYVLHGVGEKSAALVKHGFGLSALFLGDIEPCAKFVALEVAQKFQ